MSIAFATDLLLQRLYPCAESQLFQYSLVLNRPPIPVHDPWEFLERLRRDINPSSPRLLPKVIIFEHAVLLVSPAAHRPLALRRSILCL
jgi:hypothetical protein